ncbi:MAG: class I SAM-dependent methyltransferase [Lachnospiraceae bacterium]|nr:class I SAM-dependent methyltransferase [Lachnospiraceae bacterium]
MEAYTGFAEVYDTFMDNVPYETWGKCVHNMLQKYNVKDGLMLDLGCGTGTLTEYFAKIGYDMIGIDISYDMLNIAINKRFASGLDILYLEQDMREFELYGTVRAVISICDSLNYILAYDELVEVFRLVNNYLDPRGIFVFDINTIYKYEQIGDSVIAENRDECSFIWENTWHEQEKINEYDLSIFVKGEDGRYDRFAETHYQKGYTLEQIKNAIREAGMEFVEAQDAVSGKEPCETSERIYVIAREHGKEKC